jgi:hypothetical protein
MASQAALKLVGKDDGDKQRALEAAIAQIDRAFVGDVRAGRCGLGGVSTERLLSCFLRPPPLTALCGPPAAVAAAAASAPAVYSSSITLYLGFALRSPRLNEMTDAWLVSKLSTALRR